MKTQLLEVICKTVCGASSGVIAAVTAIALDSSIATASAMAVFAGLAVTKVFYIEVPEPEPDPAAAYMQD